MNIKKINYLKISIVCLIVSLNACSPANRYVKNPNDPWEPFNRVAYKFNKTVDKLYVKPITSTYELIIPKPIRKLIHNFFVNISEVPTTINNLLQAKYKQSTESAARFVINSTLGVGGLFDVAAKANLKHKNADFGQTLATWGYKKSTYLVIPLFGPSTVRDGIGIVGGTFISVQEYLKPKWRNRYYFAYTIDRRSDLQEAETFINNLGIDEYQSMRDSYLQNRDYMINQQNTNKTLLSEPPE